MKDSVKRVLLVGLTIIIVIDFFFRDYTSSYFDFFFSGFVMINALAIMFKYISMKESTYYFPIVLGLIFGIWQLIIGLTSPGGSIYAGLSVVIGGGMIVISFASYFLKIVIDRTLFNITKKSRNQVMLYCDFILFGAYMILVSNRLTSAFNGLTSGFTFLLLIIMLLNVLYLIIQFLFKKYLKHTPVDFIYSALLAIIGLSLFITFVPDISTSLLINLNITYTSFLVFICISLVGDIFRIINIEQ